MLIHDSQGHTQAYARMQHAGPCIYEIVLCLCVACHLSQAINVPVFEMGTQANPVDIAKAGVAHAKKIKADAVIIDTAGRLQVRGCETRTYTHSSSSSYVHARLSLLPTTCTW